MPFVAVFSQLCSMPPSPAFGWLCVVHTIADIACRSVQIRAAQAVYKPYNQSSLTITRENGTWGSPNRPHGPEDDSRTIFEPLRTPHVSVMVDTTPEVFNLGDSGRERSIPSQQPKIVAEDRHITLPSNPSAIASDPVETGPVFPPFNPQSVDPAIKRNLTSSKVPSSRIGRLFHYGGLAASLSYGAASEMIRRSASISDESQQGSLMLTEANIKRLVSKLSQMRGAALKLGQFMSIQDTHILPPDLDMIFRRVQDSAHYMPDWQMEEVLISALGPSWVNNFASFDRVPFAAASIGQVHHAVLSASASPTGQNEQVAVKIQFPNIANSIASDLGYVKLLLTAGKLLPKGLFLDRTVQVMKDELADECNYSREAQYLRRYRSAELLGLDSRFKVPWVWEGSADRVLVMEKVDGVSVGELSVAALSQQERNEIAKRIIELCLRELFDFRLMQTDPNWSNFLWNSSAQQVSLVDFGATREYTKEFMDDWLRLLQAAAVEDRAACASWSVKIGYLTGKENEIMLNAHIDSMILLATPFKPFTPQPFTFGPGSRWEDITNQIRSSILVMLEHRLTPPPRETYSLNRKLSGAFLLASRLRAVVDTKRLWDDVVGRYQLN